MLFTCSSYPVPPLVRTSLRFRPFFGGWGLLRKAQHCSSHIFDNIFSLHYVSLRSRPPAEEKPRTKTKEALQTTMLPAVCFGLFALLPPGFPLRLSSCHGGANLLPVSPVPLGLGPLLDLFS